MHLFGVDSLHHVLEFRDRCSGQWSLGLVPVGDRIAEQLVGLFNQPGQNGGEINDQLPEEVQGDAADIVQFGFAVGIFLQYPRSGVLDELVGHVGQCHHFPHRRVEVAGLVGLGDPFTRLGRGGKQPPVVGVGGGQVTPRDELGRAAGQVDQLSDQVGVHLGDELVEVQVEIVESRAELGGVVVTQPGGVQVFEVGRGLDESALRLRHLSSIDGQETVDVHFRRQVEAGGLEHGRPEQRVEVGDVLADEVVHLGLGVSPPRVEILAVGGTPLVCRGHIADRSVKPDVPEVTRGVGDLEPEVRFGSRDIPVPQRFTQEMPLEVVGDLRLQVLAVLCPFFKELVQLLDLDEKVIGGAGFGCGTRERAAGVDQVGGAEVGQALVTAVTVLVGSIALGTGAADEPVGQECALDRVEQLGDLFLVDQSGVAERLPDLGTLRPVFVTVGAAVVVEGDIEAGEVADVGLLHFADQFLLGPLLLAGADHDRGAVSVVGTQVNAAVTAQVLKPDPDVGLDVLDQVTDVDVPVGVRQGRGHQDPTPAHCRLRSFDYLGSVELY